ncbi:uncharacterized protein [Leptinotarsa decemlineata]|uniref:uncharacterized protein n=1 Tax=Leptinotarsa decemlineata TaxID=7539 RepID=UPI003D307F67
MNKKRDRSVNSTREETEKLISLVEEKRKIIENKKSDVITWYEKEGAWKAIETEFNCSSSGIFRNVKNLKCKYDALKRDTRKKASFVKAELYRTGGGTSKALPLTPVEEKVKEMVLLSIEGDESLYDSDKINNFETTEIATEIHVESSPPFPIEVDELVVVEDAYESLSPPKKKKSYKPEAGPSNSEEGGDDKMLTPPKKWNVWKTTDLKSKKHPALSIPKERKPYNKLVEAKLEVASIQKELVEEELSILREDAVHKRIMRELEVEHMHLKIELLKADLERAKKVNVFKLK